MRWHDTFFILRAVALAAAGLTWPGCTSSDSSPATLNAQPREAPAGEVIRLDDVARFKQVALQGGKPVLVFFYKGGCPTCIPVDGMMDTLAREYQGRVVVTKFMLMTPFFAVTSPELQETYGISFFPAVLLFVNGKETWRFLMDYNLNHYRKGMNEALGLPATVAVFPG